ncbi:MAG: hypothetical protein ACKO2P_11025 [Planctomycetota bacterium]
MRTVRCLLQPAAAAWLLCSMGTVLADEGVARTSDLRPSTGVASTTALRVARQEAAAAPAPEAAPPTASAPVVKGKGGCCEEGCGEGGCGCGKKGCCADGCGEHGCSCGSECCGKEGCNAATRSSSGLLSRLFAGKGSSSRAHAAGSAHTVGSGHHAASGAGSAHAVPGSGLGSHAGNGTGSGFGAAQGHGSGNGAVAGDGSAAGALHAHNGTAPGGLNALQGQPGSGSDAFGHHGSVYNPSSPGHWFGGHGAGVCPNCQCNPCRCNGAHGTEFVDYGDRVFSCLFGWALPSGACGQGLPLVGKYHMVYADQPGYANPADTRLYSAQGYGMPMTVPLAPTVNYQYNYSSGIPASRITTIGTWNPITSPQALPHQSW